MNSGKLFSKAISWTEAAEFSTCASQSKINSPNDGKILTNPLPGLSFGVRLLPFQGQAMSEPALVRPVLDVQHRIR